MVVKGGEAISGMQDAPNPPSFALSLFPGKEALKACEGFVISSNYHLKQNKCLTWCSAAAPMAGRMLGLFPHSGQFTCHSFHKSSQMFSGKPNLCISTYLSTFCK
jgi:hypothetical protein